MKATICRKAHFNAAHRLHNAHWSEEQNHEVFGKCNNPNFHGHNYLLEIKVRGEVDPETGYVMDTKILKNIIEKQVIERFDHKNLNLDTDEFKNLNPTAENIAMVVHRLILPYIPNENQLTIILHETENNYVEYIGNEH